MPRLIIRLDNPIVLYDDIPPIEYINLFRMDMETSRPNPTQDAYFKRYYAACDARGKEILREGKPVCVSVIERSFIQLTEGEKSSHAGMLTAAYTADATLMPSGSIVEAEE